MGKLRMRAQVRLLLLHQFDEIILAQAALLQNPEERSFGKFIMEGNNRAMLFFLEANMTPLLADHLKAGLFKVLDKFAAGQGRELRHRP